jgi:cell division protein FtsB
MKLHRILKALNNKYFYTLLAFLVWITFFDRNNFIAQYKLRSMLKNTLAEKDFYTREISKDSSEIILLTTDTASLEKLAREKYLMKKDDEDIYLIVRE